MEVGHVNKELLNAIAFLAKEKGVAPDVIYDSLEAVLLTAYKKEPEANPIADVEFNRETGDYRIVAAKNVVETVTNMNEEISLEDAQQIHSSYEIGDMIHVDVTPNNFSNLVRNIPLHLFFAILQWIILVALIIKAYKFGKCILKGDYKNAFPLCVAQTIFAAVVVLLSAAV